MLGRRLLLLVAVLMGLTALAASVAPRQQTGAGTTAVTPTRTPVPAATEPPEAAPRSAGRVVELTVSAAPAARPAQLEARVGDIVRLEVSGDVLDAVEIQGSLDLVDGIAPEAPARFEILADRAGSYPIALDEAGRRLATLKIVGDR